MKRMIVFVVIGLVMFGVGFGGGLMLGRTMASGEGGAAKAREVAEPGPIVTIGEFTSNLAGAGRHVVSFTVSLELVNKKEEIAAAVQNMGWLVRIKNEILLIAKDKTYDHLNSAEGTVQFQGDIKRVLNSILPNVGGEAPIAQVLFESFVLQ